MGGGGGWKEAYGVDVRTAKSISIWAAHSDLSFDDSWVFEIQS